MRPSLDPKTLAKILFDAYGEEANWQTWDKKRMPRWDAVGEEVQSRWVASAKALVAYLTASGDIP